VLVFLALSFYNRSADASFRQLEDQEQKSQELIHALLPAYIAEKMARRGANVADWHSEASVLFATVTGFDQLYQRVSAVQLVELLRQVFEEFDELVQEHGVEKINTLGTNYVAATGIDTSRSASSEQLARVAIGMRRVVEQLSATVDHPFGLRIGISTGDVVSGVIGEERPSFDIWGRTVELANTIRDDAANNTIVVNEAAYWRLKKAFRFQKNTKSDGSFLLLEET
jgi:class 3 adenylate cyclase